MSTPKGWTWVAAGDFNKDGWNDVVLLAAAAPPAKGIDAWVYENTCQPQQPFTREPSRTFHVPEAEILRVGPTVTD